MVGMLIADKTPMKLKKQPTMTKKRVMTKNSSRTDQTDSEDDESGAVQQQKKRSKRVISDDGDEEEAISFPSDLKFLARLVICHFFICISYS